MKNSLHRFFFFLGISFFTLMPLIVWSSETYKQGNEFAGTLQNAKPQDLNLGEIPFYDSEKVGEKKYFENPAAMGDAATNLTHGEGDIGNVLKDGLKTRREFHEVFDANHPLVKDANEFTAEPLKIIGGKEEREVGRVRRIKTMHTCIETDPKTYKCKRQLVFKAGYKKERIYEGSHVLGWHGDNIDYWVNTPDEPDKVFYNYHDGCNLWHKRKDAKWRYQITPLFKNLRGKISKGTPKVLSKEEYDKFKETEPSFEWVSTCDGLERYSDQEYCKYVSKTPLPGKKTRIIEGASISEDLWEEELTFVCPPTTTKNTCHPLREAGCEQISLECIKRMGEVCVVYKKTFKCFSQKKGKNIIRIKGKVPFCLDGNCAKVSWDPNSDFALAMSKLAIFKEIGKDLTKGAEPMAFKGQGRGCTKTEFGVQNCCDGSGGWGESLNLANDCSASEKLLRQERDQKKCHFVGEDCVMREPITDRCLKKKSVFCCFGSKLSKIFHEQGRAQLGISWGDAEHPQCRGFKIEELQQIDFEKIDLSELFEEIQAQTNIEKFKQTAENLKDTWTAKVNSIEKGDKQGEGENAVF